MATGVRPDPVELSDADRVRLEALVSAFGEELTLDELAEATGYSVPMLREIARTLGSDAWPLRS